MQSLIGKISKPAASIAMKGQATLAAIDCREAPCTLITLNSPSNLFTPDKHSRFVPHPKCEPEPDDLVKAYRIPFAPYPEYSRQEKLDIFERWMMAFNKVYESEVEMMKRFEDFCEGLDTLGDLWSANRERVRIVKRRRTPDMRRFPMQAERLKFGPDECSDVSPRTTLQCLPHENRM